MMFLLQVHTNFKAVYHNFTNMKTLDVCTSVVLHSFRNLQEIKSMFQGLTCGEDNTSNEINTDLYVKEMYDMCPNATYLHNVTTFEEGIYLKYCGKSLLTPLLFKIINNKIKYALVNFDIALKHREKLTVSFLLYG